MAPVPLYPYTPSSPHKKAVLSDADPGASYREAQNSNPDVLVITIKFVTKRLSSCTSYELERP
eukprot:9641903-Heterocapsa_arctica.AAC.1